MAHPSLSSSLPEEPSAQTKTRSRSQTVGSNALKSQLKESSADKLGFRVSKEKLLLIKARAPDYYTVSCT
jgi:hypothetical protein